MSVFIIAEAGVNHNGDLALAKRLVDAALDAGADAVKFQTFKTENLVKSDAPLARYQEENIGPNQSQFQMLKGLELSFADFEDLKRYCDKKGIMFLSTPFDVESARFLKELGLPIFKIASGEITDYPLLKEIGGYGGEIILSTGMSALKEVAEAIDVLIANGADREKIALLHCNTEYPTPFEDVNLKAMLTLKETFKVKVGYSDHTLGIEVPIAAAALGAEIIEKHFTLDKKLPGPDHKASLDPDELRAMVKGIRNIEKALGSGVKKASDSEQKNICIARKSIVARRDIKKGERFSEANLTVKRPGTGVSPMKWQEICGRIAAKDYKKDEPILE